MISAETMLHAPDLAEHIYRCPLTGVTVIEASAGTGKTYSIQTLYLRLLVEAGFPVDGILVVTFTEAATEELRDRIRGILTKALSFVSGAGLEGDSDLDRIRAVCTCLPQRRPDEPDETPERLRVIRLARALRDFDRASIFTIHGFCARTLSEQAFESASLFDMELTGSGEDIRQETVCDWFRRRTYVMPPLHHAVLKAAKWDIEQAGRLAAELLRKPDACLTPPAEHVPDAALTAAAEILLNHLRENEEFIRAEFARADDAGLFLAAFKRAWEVQLDILATCGRAGGVRTPLFPGAVRTFTAAAVAGALRKAKASAWLPSPAMVRFSALCDDWDETAEQWVLSVKHEFAEAVCHEYALRKETLQVQTFDDLLLRLRDALRDSRTAPALAARVRDAYGAALIDEFQDTDPVQYEVFRRLFIDGGRPVFLVGDPKQAIYGFRNGDIFTYFSAREHADRGYTLRRNYRSEQALIEAVNVLFGSETPPGAFATPDIRYLTLEAQGKAENASLLVAGKPDPEPFKIWFAESGDGKPLTKSGHDFEASVFATVTAEAAALLSDPHLTVGERRLTPNDIAVLVMTHQQALRLQRDFSRKRIPTVLQATGSVFDSPEAFELLLLLRAIMNPSDGVFVRELLASSLLGWSPRDLVLVLDETACPHDLRMRYENVCLVLRTARTSWHENSFVAAVDAVMDSLDIRCHLLSLEQGERRLTNLLQLIELIHEAARELRLGPGGIMTWLIRQCCEQTRDAGEEAEMRLETDRQAVRIMTVFKSKGLQFPIVFAPWMWHRQARVSGRDLFVGYHRDDLEGRPLLLDLAGGETPVSPGVTAAELAEDEQLAEQLRLLYVALTRAVHRTYLFWGHISSTTATGPAYLLHACRRLPPSADSDCRAGIAARLPELTAAEKRGDLRALSAAAGPVGNGSGITEILMRDIDETPVFNPLDGAGGEEPGQCLSPRPWPGGRRIESQWGVTSFTGLAPAHVPQRHLAEGYDFDDRDMVPDRGMAPEPGSIFAFPAGTATGNCWHSIFEQIDFQAPPEDIRRVVEEQLTAYRLDRGPTSEQGTGRVDQVVEMVLTVISAPLNDTGLRLADIPTENRLNELEFLFPLQSTGLDSHAVRGVLLRHRDQWPVVAHFENELLNWDRRQSGGFMTGFLDLVFRAPDRVSGRDRYYLVDYKSNSLGGSPDSFTPAALPGVMAQSAYLLQYLIYTVALDRFLSRSIPGYTYETDFGGIFYLFLRGVDACGTRGIYRDLPPCALIRDLSRVLGDFDPPPAGSSAFAEFSVQLES